MTAQTARPGAWADALTPKQAAALDGRLCSAYLVGRATVNKLSRDLRKPLTVARRRELWLRRARHRDVLADLYDLHLDLMDRRS